MLYLTMFPEMDTGSMVISHFNCWSWWKHAINRLSSRCCVNGTIKGNYTFFGHLKWTPAIALGYAASIYVHLLYNSDKFDNIPIVL